MGMNLGKLQEMVRDREAWHAAVLEATVRQDWETEHRQQSFICGSFKKIFK